MKKKFILFNDKQIAAMKLLEQNFSKGLKFLSKDGLHVLIKLYFLTATLVLLKTHPDGTTVVHCLYV